MIITSRTVRHYKIEMTSEQAYHLHIFLDQKKTKHVSELNIEAERGPEVADCVREVLSDLLIALENRDSTQKFEDK